MGVDVSVLIVSYNTAELTTRCLESLPGGVGDLSVEVIVVDNASPDGSAQTLAGRFPAVRMLPQTRNLGFGRAVNLAAAEASGEYLLLLNPDTVVRPGAVEALVAYAGAHPEHGLYGGRTLRPDGTVDPGSCWGQGTVWSLFCFATGLATVRKRSRVFDPESLGRWDRDTVREVGIVTGCLLLVRRELFRSLGGFDPRYFMYGEDADLAARARAAGWRPVIVPDAEIVHHAGASSARRADKIVLLMAGRMTLVRARWRQPRRAAGAALLGLGVGVRALGRGLTGGPPDWVDAWARRDEWWTGYPAPPGS